MLNTLIMLVLLGLGLYILVTSVQALMAGNKSAQNIVYIVAGSMLVLYNLKVVGRVFSK